MKNDTASLVTLPDNGNVGVLERRKILLVSLAFALELFGNLLLKYEGFESVVSLLLGTGKAHGKAGVVVLLLVDETS